MRDIRRAGALLLLGASLVAAQSGIEAFRDGRYSVALHELKNAKDATGQAYYALAQAATGDCGAALPVLLRNDGRDATLARLTGIAAVKCSSGPEAFRLMEELEQKYPNDPDVLYTGARLYMKGFNDATLAMFQRTPASYRVHELSAEIFEIENRYQEAAAEYQKAIELNRKAVDLHYRLGRAILLQGHDAASLDRAAAEFRAELELSPEDAACEFQLGQIASVENNSAVAEADFKRALALSPGFAQAALALGKIYVRQKRDSEAIALLEGTVREQPRNEAAHYTLMTAYRDAGRMDKAKAEKATLDRLQQPAAGEFSEFLKKLGEKPTSQ